MTGYVENPMEVANKLPELISEHATEHKINIEKSILLLHMSEEPTESRIIQHLHLKYNQRLHT